MGFLSIALCLFNFALNSLIGLFWSIPVWILLTILFLKYRVPPKPIRDPFIANALVVLFVFLIALGVAFFSGLDFGGLHEGEFECPSINRAGVYWPSVYGASLTVYLLINRRKKKVIEGLTR